MNCSSILLPVFAPSLLILLSVNNKKGTNSYVREKNDERSRSRKSECPGKLIEVGFRADFVMEGKLLIELKAVEQIIPVHKAQGITYLKILKLPLGLMINFNEVLIKDGIRRILNIPKK